MISSTPARCSGINWIRKFWKRNNHSAQLIELEKVRPSIVVLGRFFGCYPLPVGEEVVNDGWVGEG